MQETAKPAPRALIWVVLVLVSALGAGAADATDAAAQTRDAGNQSGYRSWPLRWQRPGRTGFTLLEPAETGAFFTNQLSATRSITNHVLLNGSGVAAGDVDGDGRVDLYFCGLDGPNRLYRNLGDWHFQDITESAGVACPDLDATGAVLADLDGDGDLDLVVNSIGGGTRVFLNDGKARFVPAPANPVLNKEQAGTSLALADMDGDGTLDLYIANYRPMFFFLDKPETRYSVRMIDGALRVTMIDGRPLTDPEFTNRFVFQVNRAEGKVTFSKEELGQVDVLYRNDGNARFTPVPFTGGAFQDEDGKALTEPPRDWGLSVMFRDLNGDGYPDLYVCNDFRTPDRIWLNDGHGHFHALARLGIRQTCLSAMGLDVADVNRDRRFDIFVADMLATVHERRLTQRIDIRPEVLAAGQVDNRPQFSRNMLQISRGDGTFAEVAQFSGLEASDWTWSPVFLDVDLDGFEDLIVANGFERDTMNVDMQRRYEMLAYQQKLAGLEKLKLRKLYPRLATPNLAFRNLGNGQFADVSNAWGFDTPTIAQGMCLADLDNDGDLDVVANNLNAPAGLYRNESTAPRIAVRLKGASPNTRGIGAKIEVFGGPVYQSQEIICGGRYCSSDDPMRTFAAGSTTNRLRLVVTWRRGKQSIIDGAQPNRLYEVEEALALAATAGGELSNPTDATLGQPRAAGPSGFQSWLPAESPAALPMFRDVSQLLNHIHHEDGFDDFQRQSLLPMKLSQLGPGLCWFDLDGDGWEDLAIPSGHGGRLGIYRNTGRGAFKPIKGPALTVPVPRDELGIVGWHRPSGEPGLLVASSSYEDGQRDRASVLGLSLSGKAEEVIPGSGSSAGALALGDIDGDGDLDLFVAGRVIPARYPEPASSRIFRNNRGQFELDAENSNSLERIGLVSSAVWTDLNADGRPDLVLACEWGPVRILRNEGGHLVEKTDALGLGKLSGWWTGVNAGDFDGDGRLDIVAGNWGRNSRYAHFREQPLRLYYGDFNGDGGVQMLEAYFDPKRREVVPWRRFDDVAKALPFIQATFNTFEQFGQAAISEILRDKPAAVLAANHLDTTVFLNRGDHFEPVPLPLEAQLSPAFGVCVGDLDGDGQEDLFLSQNFFAVQTEMSRYDAGRSLWLRGDGHGRFQSVAGQRSGLLVYGEQRGAALCDYDADGRLDIAVAENSAQTKLFHNERARPGLRVRLKGSAGNPDGIGAVLRLVCGNWTGPAREVHAGSGYDSQDGAVQVLSGPSAVTALEVRWPWAESLKAPVPAGAREIEVDATGAVRVVR